MSIIMTLRLQADPQKLEAFAAANQDHMDGIRQTAQEHGLIAHRFYGSDAGQIMVIDEWPDAQSFESFFAATQDRIEPIMREAGATSEPDVTIWHKLDTHDEVGWDA